jgi:hypothetical protein
MYLKYVTNIFYLLPKKVHGTTPGKACRDHFFWGGPIYFAFTCRNSSEFACGKPPQWKISGIFARNNRKISAKHSRNYREINAK